MLVKIVLICMIFLFHSSPSFELTNKINPELNAFNQKWEFISDTVMGGISSGTVSIIEEGEKFFLKLQGKVSLENNGGFIQVRSAIDIRDNNYKGIEITLRGNGEKYSTHITTDYTLFPWQYYAHEVLTTKKWKTVKIYFDEFKKSHFYQPKSFNSKEIKTLGFVAIGKNFDVELDVKDIKLF